MSDFEIKEVLSEERFHMEPKGDFPGGDFVSYTVRFEGAQGNGEALVKRKAASPAPVAGEVMDAEIVHKGGRVELKKVWKQNGSGGGAKSSSGDFRTPQQIMRSDAHGKAMHWCDIKVAAGEWKPITWEQYIAMVDRYYDDITSAA